MTRMDVNKDGFLFREDYNLVAEQLAEYGCLTEKQADSAYSGLMEIADNLNTRQQTSTPRSYPES